MAKRGPKGPNRTSFKKGTIPNPTGYNGRDKDARWLAQQGFAMLMEKPEGQRKTYLRLCLEMLIKAGADGNVGGIKELFDRVFGKAKDFVEVTGKDGKDLQTAVVILPPNGHEAK
jgi:hypothetical protein